MLKFFELKRSLLKIVCKQCGRSVTITKQLLASSSEPERMPSDMCVGSGIALLRLIQVNIEVVCRVIDNDFHCCTKENKCVFSGVCLECNSSRQHLKIPHREAAPNLLLVRIKLHCVCELLCAPAPDITWC